MAHPLGTGFVVGGRIIEARDAKTVTQAELADACGVSAPTVSRWERNERVIEPSQLSALANRLELSTAYFLKPMPDHGSTPIFFRSLASATARVRAKERAKVRWLQHISLVLQQYLAFPKVDIPDVLDGRSYSQITDADLEVIAEKMRLHWDLGERPIPTIGLVAENAGVIVGVDKVGSNTIDGQGTWSNADGRPYILLARDKYTAYRRQMDIAHELSHIVLHKDVTREQFAADFELIEHQAKYLAGAILLPQRAFVSEITSLSLDAFLSLKPKWMVAISAMIMRATQLGLLSERAAQGLWRYKAQRGWAKNEPLDAPHETPVEEPRLLRRSFELIGAKDVRKRRELLDIEIGLGQSDVEMLASLPHGFFSEVPGQVIRLEPKLRSVTDAGNAEGDVVPFRKTT